MIDPQIEEFLEHFGVKGMLRGDDFTLSGNNPLSPADILRAQEHLVSLTHTSKNGETVTTIDLAMDYNALTHFTPTTKQRQTLARTGVAMPDGSFYIRNRGDLDNAISAVGRATPNAGESEEARRNAVRRHIIKRARVLGFTNMIPDTWNSDGTLKQSSLMDEIDDFLMHFGVKGMRWGVRRGDNASGGSASHPVSSDASTVAELKTRVGQHGTQSLSNEELRRLVTRLNLENQYGNLNPQHVDAGRKMVNEVLRNSAKQIVVQFITKNAPRGIAWLAKRSRQQVRNRRQVMNQWGK